MFYYIDTTEVFNFLPQGCTSKAAQTENLGHLYFLMNSSFSLDVLLLLLLEDKFTPKREICSIMEQRLTWLIYRIIF